MAAVGLGGPWCENSKEAQKFIPWSRRPRAELSRLPRGQSRLYWTGKYKRHRVGQCTQSCV